MFRLICMCLAVGVISAMKPESVRFDVEQFVQLPCPDTPWVDFAYFYLSDSGYGKPNCDYYMDLDLRAKVEEYCKRMPGSCSFNIEDVLGKEPDRSCVSSFELGYICI